MIEEKRDEQMGIKRSKNKNERKRTGDFEIDAGYNHNKRNKHDSHYLSKNSMSDKIRGLGEENINLSKKSFNEMTERDWRIFREDHDIIIRGGRVPYPMRNWYEGDLPNFIIEAVKLANYKKPTPIQIQGIPIGLERRDMIGKS